MYVTEGMRKNNEADETKDEQIRFFGVI